MVTKTKTREEVETILIERELKKVLARRDEELFQWRASMRVIPAEHGDAELTVPNEASVEEIVNRAGRAWSAGRGQ